MPYGDKDELPEAVRKKLSGHQLDIWRSAFNAALKEYGDESKAFAVAWAAAQKGGGGGDDDDDEKKRSKARETIIPQKARDGQDDEGKAHDLVLPARTGDVRFRADPAFTVRVNPADYGPDPVGPSSAQDFAPRPVRETAIQDVQVIESERTSRGVRLRNVQVMSVGSGNALYGNYYEPEAVQALVREVQGQPKCFIDHSLPSEVKERGHRSLRDLAGVYDRASVHYDGAAQACVADLIVRPSVYDEYIAPVLEAGDNLGISVDGIGHCPDAPRRVKGWKRFNSADLVPAGGARGMIVREADAPATKEADKEFAMGLLDQVSAGEVQKDNPALYDAIGRAYAEAHPVVQVRETQVAGPGPAAATDDTRLVALETRVREAEQRAAASDARVTELEAERNREVWARHIDAYVRECGATSDALAALVAEPFAGVTVGGPDSAYPTQEELETAIKAKAERVLSAVREAATPGATLPRPAGSAPTTGQITGMGHGGGVLPTPVARTAAYAAPTAVDSGKAILDTVPWLMPAVPVPGPHAPAPTT